MRRIRAWLEDVTNRIVVGLAVGAIVAFASSYAGNMMSVRDLRDDTDKLTEILLSIQKRHEAEDQAKISNAVFMEQVKRSINSLTINQAKVLEKLKIQPAPYSLIE